jgi:hypothetical protein
MPILEPILPVASGAAGSDGFAGTISIPSDFPTLAAVVSNAPYLIAADVTDNDPAKTNTGQIFTEGDIIGWDITDTKWIKTQGVGGVWGSIAGTLSNQTDLQTALGLKLTESDLTSPTDVKALNQSVVSGATPTLGIANMTLDDTDLVVAPTTNLQTFANDVDSALLKARGTGVTSTYVSTVVVGGTIFDQPAVNGEIYSDQGYFSITYAGATGITVADLTAASTYVYIDNTGTLQQQTSIPTVEDWHRKMFTMRIGVASSLILGFEYLNNPLGNYTNSLRDMYTTLLAQDVPFKTGQVITGRAADLGFDVSSGKTFELGGTGNINSPNFPPFDAEANADFTLAEKTTIDTGGNTNLPKFWDNNGVLTALGSTTFVGHRLYRFSNSNFVMQYGQDNYANIVLAKASVRTENYVLNPILKNATFFGWWIVGEVATNTADTTSTAFIEWTIGTQGGSSNSLSGCLLKGNNLSDLLDVAAARGNLGLGSVLTDITTNATNITGNVSAINLLASVTAPIANPTFTGTVETPAIKISTGAAAGYVLKSTDTTGASSWQPDATGTAQTLSFTSPNLSISGGNTVDISAISGGSTVVVTTSGSGSTTVPAGVTTCAVDATGSGAGGAGSGFSNTSGTQADAYKGAGGGGGSAGETMSRTIQVTPGDIIYYNIGIKGNAGLGQTNIANSTNGSDGSITEVSLRSDLTSPFIEAYGGVGGVAPVTIAGSTSNTSGPDGGGGPGGPGGGGAKAGYFGSPLTVGTPGFGGPAQQSGEDATTDASGNGSNGRGGNNAAAKRTGGEPYGGIGGGEFGGDQSAGVKGGGGSGADAPQGNLGYVDGNNGFDGGDGVVTLRFY